MWFSPYGRNVMKNRLLGEKGMWNQKVEIDELG